MWWAPPQPPYNNNAPCDFISYFPPQYTYLRVWVNGSLFQGSHSKWLNARAVLVRWRHVKPECLINAVLVSRRVDFTCNVFTHSTVVFPNRPLCHVHLGWLRLAYTQRETIAALTVEVKCQEMRTWHHSGESVSSFRCAFVCVFGECCVSFIYFSGSTPKTELWFGNVENDVNKEADALLFNSDLMFFTFWFPDTGNIWSNLTCWKTNGDVAFWLGVER